MISQQVANANILISHARNINMQTTIGGDNSIMVHPTTFLGGGPTPNSHPVQFPHKI